MKKIALLSALMIPAAAASAAAQTYNPYGSASGYSSYPAYYNQGYRTGAPSAAAAKPSMAAGEHKQLSIGLDYVFGKTTMNDKSFEIENPLLGAETYHGKTTDFDDRIDSLSVNVGWRRFKYFGLEAFYQHSLSENEVKDRWHYAGDSRFAQAEYKMSYQAYGIDAVGYLPVNSRLDLLASIGLANYDIKAEVKLSAYNNSTSEPVSSNPHNFDESETAIRYGAGAQLWLSNRLSFRAMYRYAAIGGEYFDDISEVSLGLRYNF